MKCALYRHFDAKGALLYVGISDHVWDRTKQHQKSADWFEEVATITIEWFATRQEAVAAEKSAIIMQKPARNRACAACANPIGAMIASWDTRQAFALEVGAKKAAVDKWATNGRIPTEWQHKVVQAARRRGLKHITPAWMLRVHDVDARDTGASA